MLHAPGRIRVAAILGPTAIGKSRMASSVAPAVGAEIVSVDSMQVYRGMDIGTAKPTDDQRRAVPHHMLDVVDITEDFSVAQFQSMARTVVEDIVSREKVALLVGGTGLYFEALVFSLRFPPGSTDDALKKRLRAEAAADPEGLRRRLAQVDETFASSRDFANLRRVVRAMEVCERTGVAFSSFQSKRGEQAPYYDYVGVVLDAPRRALYRAIERRVDEMFESGLMDEVLELRSRGRFSRTSRQALGYREVLDHLDMGISLEETINNIKRRSRNYAKRQLTWFRGIPGLRWFILSEDELAGTVNGTAVAVRDFLEESLSSQRPR